MRSYLYPTKGRSSLGTNGEVVTEFTDEQLRRATDTDRIDSWRPVKSY
jgi:hypothetical protein